MNNVFKSSILALGVMLLMTNSSFGQSGNRPERKAPPTFKELLEKMDANDDGKLSEKEIEGPLKEDFIKVDTNEDGFISEEEFKKAPKPKGRKRD